MAAVTKQHKIPETAEVYKTVNEQRALLCVHMMPNGTGAFEPHDGRMPSLIGVWNVAETTLNLMIQADHSPKAWENPVVVQQAFLTMQLSYAMSVSALKDLPGFKTKYRIDASDPQVLGDSRYYFKYVVCRCAAAYHTFRCAVLLKNRLIENSTSTEEQVNQFYIPETVQGKARALFNHFLKFLEVKQMLEPLRSFNERHFEPWLQYDLSKDEYCFPWTIRVSEEGVSFTNTHPSSEGEYRVTALSDDE